jgi:hypothetical protein
MAATSLGIPLELNDRNGPASFGRNWSGRMLVWPKPIWLKAYLAESPFGRIDSSGRKMAENLKNGLNKA